MLPILLLFALLFVTVTVSQVDAADPTAGEERMLTDFTPDTLHLGWYVVNDDVMGGRSEGGFEIRHGELHFAGTTNTDGGGFSSIRTNRMRLDLSRYDGMRLYVKGDGRRYTWRMTTSARWQGREVSYWADFGTRAGTLHRVDIPFSDFVPKYRGIDLYEPDLDPREITGMGLMIYDKQNGPFELQLASIQAYTSLAPFALDQFRWKNRILVVSAPAGDDENLRNQLEQLEQTSDDFADRDMLLVTLLDHAGSSSSHGKLTVEEVGATRNATGIQPGAFALCLIGKDGTIKMSADTATPMSDIYALIDTMPMRQQEAVFQPDTAAKTGSKWRGKER